MGPTPIDSGLYLIRGGKTTRDPGEMRLIKNDPKYNEQWPRPLVSYERLYGVKEPKQLVHRNDGRRYPSLPEGTPFGLVGTSSMYKRESAPGGVVPEGSVTAVVPAKNPNSWSWSSWSTNWGLQSSDAGLYDNDDIHAIHIVAQEPRTDITVTSDVTIDGVAAGENLSEKFTPLAGSRWEWQLKTPLAPVTSATLSIAVKDRQGNVNRIERRFSVGAR